MTIGSDTSAVHMINIALTAANGSGQVWQDNTQMIPLGMNGNPEAFVAAIKGGLPLVNNLRVLFNEFSFNADGSMNPQFERFLASATAAGYQITLAYGSGDTQDIGLGDAAHPALTNAQADAALQANFTKMQGAWGQMMDWKDGHKTVASAVYGWDLMNEAAGYRNSIRANGSDAIYSTASFVTLYAQHCAQLAQMIEARADGHILVGGWGFNGDFQTLATTRIGNVSVLDYLRAAIGPDLVWSAHLYPGWMGTNLATDPTDLAARLDRIFAPLAGNNVLITETNIDGAVDDPNQPADYGDLFAALPEWFATNGVGLGWFPGAQTGASHLIYIESSGAITIRHQHSLAHALDAYSLSETQIGHAAAEWITPLLVNAGLRNEVYEIAAGEAQFDALTKMGTAFGYGGADTLQGTNLSNDFLYGGAGNDVLNATGGDDFLFGQGDNDQLSGGTGRDHLFGGQGNDTLDAGTGTNLMAGGAGDDTYIVRTTGDMVREYARAGTDLVTTTMQVLSLASGNTTQYANVENLTFIGTGSFRGVGNALGNILTGGAGADTLSGGEGRDSLAGRGGNDQEWGGAGADRFIFAKGMGQDQVMDFADEDQLVFQNITGVQTAAQAMSHASQLGTDVIFDFGIDGGLILHNASLATLSDNLAVN